VKNKNNLYPYKKLPVFYNSYLKPFGSTLCIRIAKKLLDWVLSGLYLREISCSQLIDL
jgi:hypothetical protein